ncbi:MAG: DUF1611 domain-containing protein [Pseudomonadota bacterium]
MAKPVKAIELRTPYLIFSGDESRLTYAKTGAGLVQWRGELCTGQLRLENGIDLGIPDLTSREAAAAGVGSLIVGVAPVGGSIPNRWLPALIEAAREGLDLVAGLHTKLSSIEPLVQAAREGNSSLVDVRVPPSDLPVASGKKRSGKRLLTVGTDCALGKKYTSLQLEKDLRAAGFDATFRATGQTGIMIAGQGIPIDAVIADFISGAAELLSPDNSLNHWDVIEGQGGIFHPAYGQVSHGLLIGSQPDAFVVCHAAGREAISGWEPMKLPSIGDVIKRTLDIGRLTNSKIRCIGISVNTASLDSTVRGPYLAKLADRYGLPCVDPLVDGTTALINELR